MTEAQKRHLWWFGILVVVGCVVCGNRHDAAVYMLALLLGSHSPEDEERE